MNLQAFFTLWQDVGLILYAILKAFLPLPSLEVVLTPLCLKHPEKWLLYSFEGAIGTCIGGAIGYGLHTASVVKHLLILPVMKISKREKL